MTKLAIIATIEAEPGRRDDLLPVLMAHRARSLKDEPGTLQFDFVLPNDDKTKVVLYGVYLDQAAFEAHRNGASMARYREESAGMVAKMTGIRGSLLE